MGYFGLSPVDPSGQGVMHLELFSLYITCMFFDPQIPGVTMKNAAGRMSNLGQSVVYSPGRMKATRITNKFLYSL